MTTYPRFIERSASRSVGFWALRAALCCALLAGIVVFRGSPGDAAETIRLLRDSGPAGAFLLGLAQVVVAASGVLPASLLGVAAGALYGLAGGFCLAASCTLAGALASLGLARSLFRPAIERWVMRHDAYRKLDAAAARDGWRLACLLRISPVMPFAATSYLLGVSSMRLRDYVIGTLAAMPALLGYVFIGTLTEAGQTAWTDGAGPLRWAILVGGSVATLALVLRLGVIAARLGLLRRPVTAQNHPVGGICRTHHPV